MNIVVIIGKRATDRIHLEVQDITDAVEVYGAAYDKTSSAVTAALILEKVDNGEYEIQE